MAWNKESLYIFEYEELLLGRVNDFSYAFTGTEIERKEAAGIIWKYAIEKLLKWSPQEADRNLTDEIVCNLKLDKCFPGIGFNKKTDYHADYRFILQYAFPDAITWNVRDEAIFCYERSAKIGRFSSIKEDVRLPKMFYMDTIGMERTRILLNYVESLYLTDMTTEEIYAFFGDKPAAKRFFRERHLATAYKFSTYESPLEYHHFSIASSRRDDAYFYANLLKMDCKAMLSEKHKELRKERKKKLQKIE